MPMKRRESIALVLLALVFPVASTGQPRTVTAKVVEAANTFLATLSPDERAKCTFGFTSSQRTGWSNLPSGIFQRNGLRFGDMTSKQREAALALVAAALSREGYQKVTDIMNGDEVLKNAGGGRTGGRQGAPGRGGPGGRGGGVRFGLDEYYIALLGAPSATAAWMIQFGGHHLAINVTVVGSNSVLTPSLPAAQPATSDVKDLVLGPGNDGKVIQPEGILASELDAKQQALLLDVVHEWVGILNDEAAAAKMAEIKNNLPKTYFAWSGSTTNGAVAYYRVQGPTLVIEYAPQQGDVNHIHTIYRDPTNDYGARLVKP